MITYIFILFKYNYIKIKMPPSKSNPIFLTLRKAKVTT